MSYQRSEIRSIDNYAEALAKWEGTKHIRGRAEDQRPLGRRDYVDSFRILKQENGAIQCLLYNTPVVTFTPEDNIVIHTAGFNSGSTRKFIDEVSPNGISAYVFDRTMCLTLYGTPNEDGSSNKESYRLKRNEPTLMRRTQTGWVVEDAVQHTVHKVNRRGKKAVMDRYQPFFAYVDAFCRLRQGEKVEDREIEEALGAQGYPLVAGSMNQWKVENRYALLMGYMASTGEEQHVDYYKATMVLLCEVFHEFLVHERHLCDAARTRAALVSILTGIHRDEVFMEEAVAKGSVKKDAYAHYFSARWDAYHTAHPQTPTWQTTLALAG